MATKKNVSVYDNVSGGSRKPGYVATPKKATSSGAKNGMAYKKTATPVTSKKSIISGAVAGAGKTITGKKMLKKATPITKRKGGTGGGSNKIKVY